MSVLHLGTTNCLLDTEFGYHVPQYSTIICEVVKRHTIGTPLL